MNEWKMKECIVKTKQPNKNEHAWYLWAVSVTVSERLRLISPGGAPGHYHSLLRPPGQTSVMTLCCNLLTGEPLPQPGSSCGLSLSLWHLAQGLAESRCGQVGGMCPGALRRCTEL